MPLRNPDGTLSLVPTSKMIATARSIISGHWDRSRSQLVSEVSQALAGAYESGFLESERTRAAVPKMGAVAALESARDALNRTIAELRRNE